MEQQVPIGWATILGVVGAVCASVAAYLAETDSITVAGIVSASLLAAVTVLGRMWQKVADTRE